ncbi:hypothetical protein Vafri_18539, partial [Volvox africanus]
VSLRVGTQLLHRWKLERGDCGCDDDVAACPASILHSLRVCIVQGVSPAWVCSGGGGGEGDWFFALCLSTRNFLPSLSISLFPPSTLPSFAATSSKANNKLYYGF